MHAEAGGGAHACRWTTPLGLPVLQPYFKEDRRSSPVHLLPAHRSEERAAPSKQSTAFPPNFVHSLDATHMMLTANACHHSGIAFAGVHDSFWTHAADVPQCRTALREQFVQLYRQPLLQRLHADLVATVEAHAAEAAAAAAGPAMDAGAGKGAVDGEVGARSGGRALPSDAAAVPMPETSTLLTEPPAAGDFDLDAVLQSTYFFN